MKSNRYIEPGDLGRLIGVHPSISNLQMAQREKQMKQSMLLGEASTPHLTPGHGKRWGYSDYFFNFFQS